MASSFSNWPIPSSRIWSLPMETILFSASLIGDGGEVGLAVVVGLASPSAATKTVRLVRDLHIGFKLKNLERNLEMRKELWFELGNLEHELEKREGLGIDWRIWSVIWRIEMDEVWIEEETG